MGFVYRRALVWIPACCVRNGIRCKNRCGPLLIQSMHGICSTVATPKHRDKPKAIFYVGSSTNKSNVFKWENRTFVVVMLPDCSVRPQSSNFDVTFFFFSFCLLNVVCAVFLIWWESSADFSAEHFFLSLFGPLQSTLSVVSLRLCPVLYLWSVLWTVGVPCYHKMPLKLDFPF